MKLQIRTMDKILIVLFVIATLIVLMVAEYSLVSLPKVQYDSLEEVKAAFDQEMEAVNAILEPYGLSFPDYGEIETDVLDPAEIESVSQLDEYTEMVLKLRFEGDIPKAYTTPTYTLWLRSTKDTTVEDACMLIEHPYFYEIAERLSAKYTAGRFQEYSEKVFKDAIGDREQTDDSGFEILCAEKEFSSGWTRYRGVSFEIAQATEDGELKYYEGFGTIPEQIPTGRYEKTLYITDYWRSNG